MSRYTFPVLMAALFATWLLVGILTATGSESMPPRLPEKPLISASFPAPTQAGAIRVENPEQVRRLATALAAAEPLRLRRVPSEPADETVCLFMQGDPPGTGPCLLYWREAALLQSPAWVYRVPPSFSELLSGLRGKGSGP